VGSVCVLLLVVCIWLPMFQGHVVTQLVEALCYKLEGQGFNSRWFYWNFSLTKSFPPHCDSRVDSASNRNEYYGYLLGGKGGWCIGLTTLPPSCDDHLEIWEPQPPGTVRACPGLCRDCFTFLLVFQFLVLWPDDDLS
jgi:hypothetical protein